MFDCISLYALYSLKESKSRVKRISSNNVLCVFRILRVPAPKFPRASTYFIAAVRPELFVCAPIEPLALIK